MKGGRKKGKMKEDGRNGVTQEGRKEGSKDGRVGGRKEKKKERNEGLNQ